MLAIQMCLRIITLVTTLMDSRKITLKLQFTQELAVK